MTLLADTLVSTPDDSATTVLPYEYLHTRNWNRATNAIVRTDTQRWRHADGSGREVTRRAPDLQGVHHQPTRDEQELFDAAEPTTIRYRPGELATHLPDVFPSDTDTLIARLVPPELAAEPTYPRLLVDRVVAMASHHHLDPQQRAATLQVLAAVPGITYQGLTTDLAGRTGMSFHVVAEQSTSSLVIDPTNGQVLSAEERVDSLRPGLFTYVLIVARGRAGTDRDPASHS
ncbi:hypothetical protein D0Q02_29630 [Micromonospora craniellae]|uniref:Uncharacterized protein n=1 Tax=Micromonospora craniellae TaxID=2294034 RepID=A0A372FQU9_9ACTN|nr:hypothetical protein ID554_09920 [Micromonospora craniellae]RFS41047.1 hypothetical protein D0Q02_29630 [Micromonospora craniellae]